MKQITEEQASALFHDVEQLQRAYQLTFGSESGQAVLADFAKFCRANEPCWSEDQRHHARLEGRREVYLRIKSQMELSPEELMERRLGHQYAVVKIEDNENG